MIRWCAIVSVLCGCLPQAVRECANGVVCPLDRVCTQDGRCALPEEVAACDGLHDGATCVVGVGQGTCAGGACALPECGDGIVNGAEACDGTNLDGATCHSRGFYDDTPGLACNDFCKFDVTSCKGFCGDGARNGPEVCEGDDVGGKSCLDFGFDRGHLGCTPQCGPDPSGCGSIGWQPLALDTPDHLYGIWGSSANDVFTVGGGGSISHFDGSTWSSMASGTAAQLEGIWGTAPDDVFAGGLDVIVHYDGTSWSPTALPGAGQIHAVWASSRSDVYALGISAFHFDGASWSELPLEDTPVGASRGGSIGYKSVWGSGPSDVYVVYDQGACCANHVWHFDGASWTLGSAGNPSAQWMWGRATDDIYLVGGVTVEHSTGFASGWEDMPFPNVRPVVGVWASGPSDAFAVGSLGSVFHYDGQRWATFPSGGQQNLWAVWGTAPDNVIVVGNNGSALRYPGATWQPIVSGTTYPMREISGTPATDSFAAIANFTGVTQLLHCDATGCAIMSPTDASGETRFGEALAVWASATDVFVATDTRVLHWDRSNYWTVIGTSPEITNPLGLWSSGPSDAYVFGLAAGAGWTIAHYDGTSWSTVLSSTTFGDRLSSIWGSGPSDVFAVGASATGAPIVMHFDGTSWTAMPNPAASGLRGLWGTGPHDVFAVGDGGTVLHYDGTTWSAMSSGTTKTLNAVWIRGADDVFAVGQGGLILHLDPRGWAPIRSNTTFGLNGVWGDGATTYFSGDGGTFLELVQTTPL